MRIMKNDSTAPSSASIPPGGTITARPHRVAYGFYIVGVVVWVGLSILSIGLMISDARHNFPIVLVLVFAAWQLWLLSRFPVRVTTDGLSLTTVSLRGTSTLRLSDIARVSTALLVLGRTASIYYLACRGHDGTTVYLQLGSLPRSQRTQLFAPLVKGFKAAAIRPDRPAAALWRKWYRYPGAPIDPQFP